MSELSEHISDITQSGVSSYCCGATVYLDFCGECKDHCTAVYDDIECKECGDAIVADEFDNGFCIKCGKKYES